MSRKLRITFDKIMCIGNKACLAVDPDRWELDGDKVSLIGGREQGGGVYILEKEFSDEEAKKVIEAAQACPVYAIGITDVKTKEEIVKLNEG